jgi:HK97 family phage portal protein
MAIFDRLFGRQQQQVDPQPQAQKRSFGDALGAARAQTIFGGSSAGSVVNADTAMASTTVRACVQKIAHTVASLDVDVFTVDGTRQTKIEHPISPLLKVSPVAGQTAFDLWENLISDAYLYGTGFAAIERDNNARVLALRHIDANTMKQTTLATGETAWIHEESENVFVDDELFLIRGFRGVSLIQQHRETISLERAAENFGSTFFGSGGNVSGVISTDHSLTDEQFERLSASWAARYHGPRNQHRTAILEHGMKYERIGTAPESAQFIQTRKFQAEMICSAFGVSPALIGLDASVTYNNVEQQSIFFAQYTIAPLLRRIQQQITVKLLAERERATVEARFNISSLLRADAKTRGEYFTALIRDGVVSINEAREALENLNPIEGGDTHFVPLNLGPLSSTGNQTET